MKVAIALAVVALVLATTVTAVPQFECNSIHGDEEPCTREFRPVCGADGVTYPNLCRLRNAACKLNDGDLTYTEGACAADFACPTICPEMYQPVCGTDGITYGNLCNLIARRCEMFRASSSVADIFAALVTRAHDGECAPAPSACDEVCDDQYAPVCGTNGRTFPNACELRRFACTSRDADLTVEFEGACDDCPDLCTEEYVPVCASNGRTYGNLCAFKRARCATRVTDDAPVLRLLHSGECVAESPCDEACPMSYEPVCGSDGNTYSNECELRRHSCLARTDISVVAEGACQPAAEPCAEACPMTYEPVCGSDGNTYSNECELTRQSCLARTTVTVAKQGACEPAAEPCAEACPMTYEPVCGSDGNTYSNECELTRQSCLARTTVTVAKQGECDKPCNKACEKKIDPVCGSDGRTYVNLCLLELAACQARSDLKFVSKGACAREPEVPPTDACAENACSMNEACVPEPKQCFTEPCPQFRCVKIGGGACADMVCGNDEDCINEPSGDKAFTCVKRPVESCDTMCTMVYEPVCGSDMRIYSNACLLKQASCRRRMNGESTLTQVDMNECACDCNDSVLRLPWSKLSPEGKPLSYNDFADIAFAAGATPEEVTSMFTLMDANGDKMISEDEFNNFALAHATAVDTGAADENVSPADPTAQIVVIVVAAVAGIALISIIAVIAVRRRRARAVIENNEPLLRDDESA